MLWHPFRLAHACNLMAVVHQLGGQGALAHERAEVGLVLAHEQGMVIELGRGTMLKGWATAAEVWWPYYAALLAEGYGHAGQKVEALRILTEALALTGHPEEHWWTAELHRRQGELLLVQNAARFTVKEAEQGFQHALRMLL